MNTTNTKTLYRPVGQAELDLIAASTWRRFPPRLDWQPIFYPVLTEEYAIFIAKQWNTKDPNSGFVGYVLQFDIDADYVQQFPVQNVGGPESLELWVPAEELETFNDQIVGTIQVIYEFRS
ncbi:hypothetical protein DTL21_04365 [Bremerella cremea]|uniref:ADP-ribosylation/crystallin J1 n=1 Tax=Blastopirellula marina TaxID=124 RepID=A0A2S8FYV2_9BACT|nr:MULTISPECIES: hypothetical protein [Pirellulaceae]PQO37191.1 hypothetical protein C5Y83_04365 [Blastopirellula marina]RCS49578.1 hypothetical protein DTL21_04365 [Bremerella cremea]